MRHDDAADEARGRAPAGLLHVHQLARLVQEARAKRPCEVVAQLMARACLSPIQPEAVREGQGRADMCRSSALLLCLAPR